MILFTNSPVAIVGFLTLATLVVGGPARPNILFLQCDEMDGRILDPTHPLSHVTSMPHLRGLAARGVNFIRTYAENPLCAPSRASTFTGRRTSSIRVWNNVKAITTLIDQPGVADPNCAKIAGYGSDWCIAEGKRQNVTSSIRHALVDLGYDVKLLGKIDTGGGVCRNGIDKCDATGYHDTGKWNATEPVSTYFHGDLIHSWAGSAGIDRPIFKPLEGPNRWINETNPNGGPFNDWSTIQGCVDWLHARNQTSGDRPFALYCSILDPHPPYFTNATWLAHIDDDALDATINATRWQPLELVHPSDRFQFEAEGVPANYDRALARRLAKAWHGQTAETDAMMGAVIDALAVTSAATNTFILFTSDHGEMHLEHRHVEKMSHYEGSARVPMIISGPLIPRGHIDYTLVSLLDVFATFVDVAGAAPPSFADGYSLLPLANHSSHDDRVRPPYVAAMAACDSLNAGQFMLRQGNWKLITYATANNSRVYAPQLFNISADQWENHNVAGDYPDVIAAMDVILRREIDYPTVMMDYEAQGHEWGKQWTSAFPNEGWKPLLHSAYQNFSQSDEDKFMQWLNN
eukprot:m.51727 g.51727  ORF g.51727 m.51727 type:complete len:575 (+) comp21492_c0_seq1:126-1850(+)